MADTDAPAAAPSTPKKGGKAKKSSKPKTPAAHPKYNEMITAALGALKEKKGSSRQAILKYISANFKVGDSANVHLKLALKRMVQSGALTHTKGTGASGSFKLAEKAKTPKKPAKKPSAKPKKKPAAKKAAKPKPKPAAKKAASKSKKPAAKKPAAKKAKKSAAKPAAKKAKLPAKKSKAAPKKKAQKKKGAK